MILTLQDINKIIELEKSLHGGFSKGAFFKKCFEIINPKLFKYFKANLLFHSLYYVENDYTLTPIHFDTPAKPGADIIANYVGLAENAVRKKESQSFTEIILRQNLSGLILYKANKYKSIGDIVMQNLKSSQYLGSLAKKLRVKSSTIKNIATKYKLLAQDYYGEFFIHFIRPFASHQHYNGVLLLILKNQLTESEYMELAHIWNKVLSEPQLFEFSKASKLKLLDTLNKELSHIWNNYFESLKNVVQFDLLSAAVDGNMDKLKAIRNFLLANISSASKVQLFFTSLNKAGEEFENKSIPPLAKEVLGKTDIDLKLSMMGTLEMLLAYFNPDNNTKTDQKKIIQTAIASLKNQPTLSVYGNRIAIEIILFNLLKNSVAHCGLAVKNVEIKLSENSRYIIIQMINSGVMKEEWCNFINEKKGKIDNIEFSYGIRTVKRIINVKHLNNHNLPITISARNNTKQNSTTITLKLPKYNGEKQKDH